MTAKLHSQKPQSEKILLGELQLLLAEKRTYFALLRTGIAIFTLPLTVLAFLWATREYHKLFDSIPLATVVILGLSIISLIGLGLFFRAEVRVRKINATTLKIKNSNSRLSRIVM